MSKTEKAIFGMGCFWKPQYLFDKLKGVIKTDVGFMGGFKMFKNPSYKLVCTNITNHVEVVQITFDPKKISYKRLLKIFWKNHNPTQKNRQGLDIGTQYRSVVFYHNQKQKKDAERSLEEQKKRFDDKITTQIKKASVFYRAEDYHQKYVKKHRLKVC